jgi:hypothetical protein
MDPVVSSEGKWFLFIEKVGSSSSLHEPRLEGRKLWMDLANPVNLF